MTYIDFSFLLFLAVTILCFYLCPPVHRWKVLLVFSILFYGFSGLKGYLFLFFTSFSIWLGAGRMGRIYAEAGLTQPAAGLDRKTLRSLRAQAKARCRRILWLLLLLNIGLLCFLKFAKFFAKPLAVFLTAAGQPVEAPAIKILMPLGISYYTFSAVGYLLDVYWQRIRPEESYPRFLLFEIFFLHILQGPIERYNRLGERLKETWTFDFERVCMGLQLMLYGFFKKLVIADRVNLFIRSAFKGRETASGAILALAVLMDVIYIYTDFSGCMDIARGAAQIMGIEMDLNFNHPFGARSIVEFWRRWHMSLGSWFKDYVYYPVSISRPVKSLSRWCAGRQFPATLKAGLVSFLPVSVTWILTGLWHGTGKTYVAWGIYYAFWILNSVVFAQSLTSLGEKLRLPMQSPLWHFWQCFRTTLIFAGGRLLTRPGSLRASLLILRRICFSFDVRALFDGRLFKYGLDEANLAAAGIAVLILWIVSLSEVRLGSLRMVISRWILPVRWLIWLGLFFVIIVFGIYGPGYSAASFVYMAY